MPTIPVQLPDELQQYVEAKIRRGQFSSISDYIVALVHAAKQKRTDIETALIEGIESGPAEEWTSQEWQDIKRRISDR